jgi:hypothetical protein
LQEKGEASVNNSLLVLLPKLIISVLYNSLLFLLEFYNSFVFISYELMFPKLSASSETAVRTTTITSCRSTYRTVATTEGTRTVSERSTTIPRIRTRSETLGWAGSIATAKAAHHRRTTTEASTVATERTTRSAVV